MQREASTQAFDKVRNDTEQNQVVEAKIKIHDSSVNSSKEY